MILAALREFCGCSRRPGHTAPPSSPPPPPLPRELTQFIASPCGRHVLPEYRSALSTICVSPALLSSSPFIAAVEHLSRLARDSPPPPASELLPALIRRAYKLPSRAEARAFATPLPAFELGVTHLFPALESFLDNLRWEGPIVRSALQHLLTEGHDGLALLLGTMAHASTSCASRRRAAVSTILLRITPPAPHAAQHGATADSLARVLVEGVSPPALAAARRLHSALAAVVHDTKDRAFESTFVQPSLMVGAAARDAFLTLDGEVHGAPCFAALLVAATGIRVSRAPDLSDEATGFTDAVAAVHAGGLEAQLATLWAISAIGRSWDSLRGCSGGVLRPSAITSDVFCGWAGSRRDHRSPTVAHLAARAADGSPSNAANRRRFADIYLAQYAQYLAEDVLLPRFVTTMLAEDASERDLRVLLPEVVALLPGGGEGWGVTDTPAAWLWDVETYPPTLHVERARTLLQLLGIVKAAGSDYEGDEVGGEAARGDNESGNGRGEPSASACVPASALTLTVGGDVRGGGTGREFARNLLLSGEEPFNKWVHAGTQQSWVNLEFASPMDVAGYAMCCANDFPQRDPSHWTLFATTSPSSSTSRRKWAPLHTVTSHAFEGRWSWCSFLLPAPVQGVRALHLRIDNVRGRHAADAVQLGHLRVLIAGGQGGGAAASAPMWVCAVCTLENPGSTTVCEACDAVRGAPPHTNSSRDGWGDEGDGEVVD